VFYLMNVLILIGLALAMAVAGFIGTAEVSRRSQNAEAAQEVRPRTGDRDRDMAETMRQFNRASGDLAQRQTYAMIGGGVGLAIGAGVDVPLQGGWLLNLDVKKVQIKTKVYSFGTEAGTFKVDPVLFSLGVGYRF
jgi:hypothetical protein